MLGGHDVTNERAVIAVQGPRARERLATVSPDAAAVGHFAVADFEFKGVPCRVAGTGYTGEDGVECAVPSEMAPAFWRAVIAAGVKPAGLGARDTLRLESGLPLHGHELGAGITRCRPGSAGWSAGTRARSGVARRWTASARPGFAAACVVCSPRGADRPVTGTPSSSTGEVSGVVTSGNFSPVLQRGIALAFLPPGTAMGATVEIALRGGQVPAIVVKPPFQRLDTWKGLALERAVCCHTPTPRSPRCSAFLGLEDLDGLFGEIPEALRLRAASICRRR